MEKKWLVILTSENGTPKDEYLYHLSRQGAVKVSEMGKGKHGSDRV